MADSSSEFPWKRFSQSEDFTVRLRNILHDYAFGPGVFRELLQNADDARARRFSILVDENVYPGSGLLDSRLEVWQGPAICAFNDAEFTDADFEGICRVGASGKSTDHAKIGRYGLGFNATYHLTDVVSFTSRDRLCIFDPHEAHLPGDLPGLQMRLPESQNERQKYAAQLAPFEAALAAFQAEAWPLRGALFRLPLRTPELAKRSQICRDSHDFKEVLGILEELLQGAQDLLLFLQSVESFEVLVRPAGREAYRLGGASLRTSGDAAAARLRAERRLLSGGSSPSEDTSSRPRVRWTCYTFLLDVDRCISNDTGKHCETSAWMVMLRAEPASDALTEADSNKEIPEFQCGAVALRLWPPSVTNGSATENSTPLVGQAFCFLPLALATGLPVHISANFALTANRRDLWRRSDDKASSHSTRRAAWNEALLQNTLPRSYADALRLLASGALSSATAPENSRDAPQQVHNLLPENGPWQQALQGQFPCEQFWALWPSIGARDAQGVFEPLAQAVAAELFKSNAEVLWVADESKYAGAKSSLLCSKSAYERLDDPFKAALHRMRAAGCKRGVVEVPERLCEMLSEVKGATWMKPQSLATCLRSSAPALERAEVDAVVSYLLNGGSGALTLLHGLMLAPLVGGGLGRFENPDAVSASDLWWIEDATFCELLPDRSFVDPASGTFQMLKPRIANAPLNVRLLNMKSLPLLLPALVPPAWSGRRAVTVVDGVIYIDGQAAKSVEDAAPKPIAVNVSRSAAKQETQSRAGTSKGKSSKAKQAAPPKQDLGPYANDDDYDWEDDWRSCEEYEYWDDCLYDGWNPNSQSKPKSKTHQQIDTDVKEKEKEKACTCLSLEDLEKVIKRCNLVWQLVERGQVKGVRPEQILSDIPCIPVVDQEGAAQTTRLLSIHEAIKRQVLAVEDFTRADRAVIALCGVPFVRPGKILRTILGIEKSSTLSALQAAFSDRWTNTSADDKAVANPRLFMGLKPYRIPIEEARPLRNLLRALVKKNLIPKDSRCLEALPIFETQGGRFAVPLAPSCSRVVSPGEEWDDALRPDFADYLISRVGEAGDFLLELGHEPGRGTSRFLAEFAAPRVGLFDQALCVRYLEAVASLGSTPWKKAGAPKELAAVTQACIEAPLVVFPPVGEEPGYRRRCSDLTDPGDTALRSLPFVSTCFPPEEYCGALALSVMRKAGLSSLTDEGAFLKLARQAEVSDSPEQSGIALLRYLGERHESLKFSSKAFALLGKLRIFPSLNADTLRGTYPPVQGSVSGVVPVALDGPHPCTFFQNADLAWTQLIFLDPEVFDRWPAKLRERFGALKDPVPLEVVIANLTEVSARWTQEGAQEVADVKRRQAIVEKHLKTLSALSKRSHATNIWAQQQLCRLPFVVMDDGALSKPTDIFVQLHAGGGSDGEDENADSTSSKSKSSKKTGYSKDEWTLPFYLRPFRRLLLSIAGPVNASTTAPSIHVGPSPPSDTVPKFLHNSLNQPELADVQFSLCDLEGRVVSVYAHRLILSAASEHFKTMFTSGCAEAVGVANGRVVIDMPDWVTPRSLLWVLAYLYQGFDAEAAHITSARLAMALEATAAGKNVDPVIVGSRNDRRRLPKLMDEAAVGEDLCCLLRLSDLYDLAHLKQWTEQRLHKLLNPDNLVAISTHAFFCNGRQLLRLCVYQMRYLYGTLAKTEEWDNLEPAIRELVLVDGDEVTSQDRAS